MVGHAAEKAPVRALHDDRDLPSRHGRVPVDCAHIASRPFRVAPQQVGAMREALQICHAAGTRTAEQLVARVQPEVEEPADVGQRITERRHLPVDDGDERRR